MNGKMHGFASFDDLSSTKHNESIPSKLIEKMITKTKMAKNDGSLKCFSIITARNVLLFLSNSKHCSKNKT